MSDEEFKRLVLARLDELRDDVTTIKADLGTLKSDVGTLKADVATLKAEVAQLNVRVSNLERESFMHYTSTTREVQSLRRDLSFFTLTFDTRLSALEQASTTVAHTLGIVVTSLATLSNAVQALNVVFIDHEHRLTAIESRP